jgi:transposase
MKKIVKQVVGIDVAQKELAVSLGRMLDDWSPEVYSYKTFPNTSKGFIALALWVKQMTKPGIDLRFVMEATGVYHELLAYFLEEKGYTVSIVLPNKISNYNKTLETKTVTDKTMSQSIVMFGLERRLTDWKRPKKVFKNLKQLTRERDQVVQMRTMAKNHLHAEQAEANPNKDSLARIKRQSKKEK